MVIPAYNEADRIVDTLHGAIGYLDAEPYDAEIIVVDDGSDDGTRAAVEGVGAAGRTPVRCVHYAANQGKGFAVREGMAAATGDYRVFYDADGSTPIAELEKLWPRFEAGADVVIGSRSLPESDVAVRQAWYRECMGKVFNGVLRLLGLTRFRDTQCGFKGFTAAACAVIFPRQTIMHFSFDAELLYIAQLHGLRVDEVPLRWLNEPKSRVHPVRDAVRMFWDLLRVRWRALRGGYD
ncbi:MAG: dolichyl-phosphate beta-glucosyltransferase [Candidatus Hydrogenedentota bacterium]